MTIPTIITKAGTLITRYKKTSIFLGLVLVGSGYFIQQTWFAPVVPPTYMVETVTRGTVATSVTGSGQVWGESQVAVTPEVSGKITKVAVKEGDTVKEGDVIATLKSTDAQKSVRDASINYQSASLSLQKLKASASATSLLQAENGLAQAQRSLESLTNPSATDLATATDAVSEAERSVDAANRNLDLAKTNSTQDVSSAYEDGYQSVTSAFLELPSVMNDIADVLGTDAHADEYVSYYRSLIGDTYPDRVVASAPIAQDSYTTAQTAYLASNYSSSDATKASLISSTLATAKLIGNTLSESHILYTAIIGTDYSDSTIASHITAMNSTITADIATVNTVISSLQSASDAITSTNASSPKTLADAEDAVTKATETLAQKQAALDELQSPSSNDIAKATEDVQEKQAALDSLNAGADTFDLRSAELTLAQRANALNDANQTLVKYTVRAPIAGVVASLTAVKGSTAGTGSALATIISKEQTVSIALNEIDAAKVAVSQHATMTFDAVESLSLTGTVASVNSLGTVSQGVVTYDVVLKFDTQDDRIHPGMSANVAITTDAHQDVLLVPNSAVKTQNGSSFVEMFTPALVVASRSQGTSSATPPEMVPVTVGLSNDTSTEIVSGVNEGGQIVTKTTTATAAVAKTSASSLFGGSSGGSTRGMSR